MVRDKVLIKLLMQYPGVPECGKTGFELRPVVCPKGGDYFLLRPAPVFRGRAKCSFTFRGKAELFCSGILIARRYVYQARSFEGPQVA